MIAAAHLAGREAPAAAFDRMADAYDATFTESSIGRAQRNVVWNSLKATFHPNTRVLDLNCGTGEDALFLAKRGVSVLGCDASSRMIEVAKLRKSLEAPNASLQFQVLKNEDLDALSAISLFDGALSNFSGLNCVADLSQVARKLTRLIKPRAVALICISTRVCLWEIIWHGAHVNFAKAFRRLPGSAVAELNGIAVPVWYPTITGVRDSFSPWFRLRSIRAVGLFVPPSYVESWARKYATVLSCLESLDRVFSVWPVLRGVGDHVLLEFERSYQFP
jgi:ubiquinone/menaquinone biosynthesis C-methylase UbiE